VKKLPRVLIVFTAALLILAILPEKAGAQKNIFNRGTPGELEKAKQLSLDILRDQAANRAVGNINDFQIMLVEVDDVRMAHTRVRQTVNGVPVWEGEAIVHLKENGELFTITDDLKENVAVNTQANLTPGDAIVAAEGYYAPGAQFLTEKPEADIWIYRAEDRDHLAYRVRLERLDGSEYTSAPVMFIDAHTGEKIFEYDNLQTGTGSSLYSGIVLIQTSSDGFTPPTFYMEDTVRRMGTFNMNSTGNDDFPWGGGTQSRFTYPSDIWNTTSQQAGVDAHYGAAKTFDYYREVFGRNGLNGNFGPGSATAAANSSVSLVVSRVHYGSSGAFNNAFWSGNQVSYGDGDGRRYGPFPSVDICGHELTHGVIQYTAGLNYSKESGALNESWADVFGAMVELYTRGGPPTLETWQIGEQVKSPGFAGDAMRYFYRPSIDHYSQRLYQGSCSPTYNTNDNCGVHSNSGIANYAYYLVAAGGTHTRSGITVVGIGVQKAQRIWYKALTSFMNSGTNFAGARTATLNAAAAIYGPDEVYTIAKSWCAVGVGDCPDLLVNGSLEGTIVPWIGSGPGFFYTSRGNNPSRGGTGYVYLGVNDRAAGQVYQTVSIPTTALGRLTFSLNVTSSERSFDDARDHMWFEVRDTSGHALTHYLPYTNRDNMIVPWIYQQRIFNLSYFRGKTVRIQFRVSNNNTSPTVFRIDNVSLQ